MDEHICACGCGEAIAIQPHHGWYGIPKFIRGHNSRAPDNTVQERAQLEPQDCACGCGEPATPGRDYISGHNSAGRELDDSAREKISKAMSGDRNHRYGKQPPNYKERITTNYGYILIHRPEHPFSHKGKGHIFEHRIVFEKHLLANDPASPLLIDVEGQSCLRPDVEIHHIDGDKTNNVVSNLQPMTKAEHARLHMDIRTRS